jgi:hypothetical protein
MLGSVSGAARRDILSDLDAHIHEALQHAQGEDEFARVTEALKRVGDPREFLAPLIAEAVFRRPRPSNDAALAWQAILLGAQRGVRDLARVIGALALGAFGTAAIILCIARLLAPTRAGVFQIGVDEIQVRLLGGMGAVGVQLLPTWGALLLGVVGVAIVALALGSLRRLVTSFLIGR